MKPEIEQPVRKSHEKGFTNLSTIFDEKQYSRDLCAHMSFNSNPDYYFGSYSHFNIHEEMLRDTARTEAYRKAILQNKRLFEGKVVLDIGCGTGILSLFAAQAGAKKVYAVDNADIAFFAKDIVKNSPHAHVIQVIHGKIEDVKDIKPNSIDVIVSEWMGYFLLYESMLDSIVTVRDKYLKKGGTVWPNKAQIFVAALEDEAHYRRKVLHWNNVYGFNMSCLQTAVLREAQIDVVQPD